MNPEETGPCTGPMMFDWASVGNYEPSNLGSSKNVDKMSELISKFIVAEFSKQDFEFVKNPTVFHLLKLLQVIMKYLMNTNDYLDSTTEKANLKAKAMKEKALQFQEQNDKLKDKVRKYKSMEKCPVCGAKFKNIEYLNKHISCVHPNIKHAWETIRSNGDDDFTAENKKLYETIDNLKATIRDQNITMATSLPLYSRNFARCIKNYDAQEEMKDTKMIATQTEKPIFHTEDEKTLSKTMPREVFSCEPINVEDLAIPRELKKRVERHFNKKMRTLHKEETIEDIQKRIYEAVSDQGFFIRQAENGEAIREGFKKSVEKVNPEDVEIYEMARSALLSQRIKALEDNKTYGQRIKALMEHQKMMRQSNMQVPVDNDESEKSSKKKEQQTKDDKNGESKQEKTEEKKDSEEESSSDSISKSNKSSSSSKEKEKKEEKPKKNEDEKESTEVELSKSNNSSNKGKKPKADIGPEFTDSSSKEAKKQQKKDLGPEFTDSLSKEAKKQPKKDLGPEFTDSSDDEKKNDKKKEETSTKNKYKSREESEKQEESSSKKKNKKKDEKKKEELSTTKDNTKEKDVDIQFTSSDSDEKPNDKASYSSSSLSKKPKEQKEAPKEPTKAQKEKEAPNEPIKEQKEISKEVPKRPTKAQKEVPKEQPTKEQKEAQKEQPKEAPKQPSKDQKEQPKATPKEPAKAQKEEPKITKKVDELDDDFLSSTSSSYSSTSEKKKEESNDIEFTDSDSEPPKKASVPPKSLKPAKEELKNQKKDEDSLSDLLNEEITTKGTKETKKETPKPKEKPKDDLFQSDYSSSSIKAKKHYEEEKDLKPVADTVKVAPVQTKKKREIDSGILAALNIGKR